MYIRYTMLTLMPLLIMGLSLSAAAELSAIEETYNRCQGAVSHVGYGSRDWEQRCEGTFDMPDPFLVKCIHWLRIGFPEEDSRSWSKACQFYCETNKNWGPWYDYEMPFENKVIFKELKRRHNQGSCHQSDTKPQTVSTD